MSKLSESEKRIETGEVKTVTSKRVYKPGDVIVLHIDAKGDIIIDSDSFVFDEPKPEPKVRVRYRLAPQMHPVDSEPEPKFKVGDRVKVNYPRNDTSYQCKYPFIAIVHNPNMRISSYGRFIEVEEEGSIILRNVIESDCDLIEEPKPVLDANGTELQEGDSVFLLVNARKEYQPELFIVGYKGKPLIHNGCVYMRHGELYNDQSFSAINPRGLILYRRKGAK